MQHNILSNRLENTRKRITNVNWKDIINFCRKEARNGFQKDNGVKILKWAIKFADGDL